MFPISDFFTRDQYNIMLEKRRAKEKIESNAIPHYLIALEQPLDVIIKHIDLKDPNYHESRFGLTPLTVSVMMKNHHVVDYLLNEKGVKPDPKDIADLTPMVYAAALCDVQSLKLIQEASQVDEIKTDVFDLFPYWKPLFKPAFPDDDKIVCYTVDNQPLSAAQFKERTNARFYSDVVVDEQKEFISLLANQLKTQRDCVYAGFSNLIRKQYPAFLKNPPRLLIGSQGEAGDGIFAGQKIPAFQLCGLYGGKLDFSEIQNEEDSAFRFGVFNPIEVRNLIPMINDGFPNTGSFELRLPDGRLYWALLSLREIQKNEPLFYDYGGNGHFIKYDKRQELNWNEMVAFFIQRPLHLWLKEISQLVDRGYSEKNKRKAARYSLKAQAIRYQLSYLFHTPTALISLFLTQSIKSEEIINVLNDKISVKLMSIDRLSKLSIEFFITGLLKMMKTLSDEEDDQFRSDFLKIIKEHGWRDIYPVFIYLQSKWEEKKLSMDEFFKLFHQACATISPIVAYARLHLNGKIPPEKLLEWNKALAKLPEDFKKEVIGLQAIQFPILSELFNSES